VLLAKNETKENDNQIAAKASQATRLLLKLHAGEKKQKACARISLFNSEAVKIGQLTCSTDIHAAGQS